MAETYIVRLIVEDDEVEWEVFGEDKDKTWEPLDRGVAAVYGDAIYDAGRALDPFMPEWLK